MGTIPTITIEFLKGGKGNINASDFDPKKHKRIEEGKPEKAPKKKTKK